jgi:hypothetical protein
MKLLTCIAGLCALGLVGAGCGGDDNDTLSYDDTGAEISAICTGLDDVGDGLTGEPQNDAPILADALPEFESSIDEVRDLEVNEELEPIRDEFVANGEEQLALIEEAQEEAEAGDKKAYRQTLRDGQATDQQSNALANDLGAEECID